MPDSYFLDPPIKSVMIMRRGKLSRIPNKGFRGITIDVMDIYPVIRYCEIKFAERLEVIKEEESKGRKLHEYVEMSPTRTAQGTLAKRYSRDSARKRHSSVYEVLDLASCLPSRHPSVKSRSEKSPVVEALDLSEFRTRSVITISSSPSENNGLATGANFAQKRSQQVADELTKSLDTAEIVKSKIPVAYPRKAASSSINSGHTSKSSGSVKSSFHLSTRSQSSRSSRKR